MFVVRQHGTCPRFGPGGQPATGAWPATNARPTSHAPCPLNIPAGSVPAPMAGEVIEVKAKPGSFVKAGQVGQGRSGWGRVGWPEAGALGGRNLGRPLNSSTSERGELWRTGQVAPGQPSALLQAPNWVDQARLVSPCSVPPCLSPHPSPPSSACLPAGPGRDERNEDGDERECAVQRHRAACVRHQGR